MAACMQRRNGACLSCLHPLGGGRHLVAAGAILFPRLAVWSGRLFQMTLLCAFWVLAGCKMDDEASARALTAQMTHPGKLIHFESRQTCTAAVYQAVGGEAKFNVPITDRALIALKHAANRTAIAFDNIEISPNEFTSLAASKGAPAAMRLIAAGTAALKCMPEDVQAIYFATLLTPEATTIVDLKNSALVILDRVTGYLYLVRGDL